MKILKQLFQSKYKNRIENKIQELTIQSINLKIIKVKYSSTHEYCRILVDIDRLNQNIKLLQSLL